jgi:type IV pilus assembly protein PilN
MASINLLPWRERRREERKKAFFVMLGISAAIAGAIVGAGILYIKSEISNQTARNNYLTTTIAELDTKIAEIRDLQQQKQDLTERMAVIQDLQGRRPVIVRLFDELVRTLPEGVYYNSIIRTEDTIALSGIADSANRVSTLMRYLEDSEWFADASLKGVNEAPPTIGPDGQQIPNQSFDLTVRVTTAGDETVEGEAVAP